MIASPLTPRIIFTNDPFVVSAGPNSDFNFNYEQFNQRALDRPNKNTLYLTSDSDNIMNLTFSIAGRGMNSPGPNVILDFFDPTDEFESRIFSRDETLVSRLNHYYIAFGTDNEFLNWSNFHYVTLHHAELLHDFNKPKTIRLHLIASFGLHQIDTGIFQENIRELDEIGDSLKVTVRTRLRTKKESQEEIERRKRLEQVLTPRIPSVIDSNIKTVAKMNDLLDENSAKSDKFLAEKNELLSERASLETKIVEYIRQTGNLSASGNIYTPKLKEVNAKITQIEISIRSLADKRSEYVTTLYEAQEQLQKTYRADVPNSPAYRELQTLIDLYKNTRSGAEYNLVNRENELAEIFYGYDVFDTAFKTTINKFLKSLYSDDISTFFISESTEDLLRENIYVSSNPWTLSQAILLGERNVEIEKFSGRAETFAGDIISDIFGINLNRRILGNLSLFGITLPTQSDVTVGDIPGVQSEKPVGLSIAVKYDDSKLQEYKTYIDKLLKNLIPEYLKIEIVDVVNPDTELTPPIQSLSQADKDFFAKNPTLAPKTVFYHEQQETSTSKDLRLLINIPSRQGDTDDDFYTKVNNFFRYLEVGLTRREPQEDKLILIKETDIKIVNLFIDYLETTDIGRLIIKDFNIRRNRPLVILGQTSVIYALLFGERYNTTRISSINTKVEEYFKNQVKPKYDKLIYEIYGSHKNILTDLQMLLEANKINESDILSNINEIAKPLLVFNHNTAENQNVLSVKVDDFKAYMRLLTIPGPIRDIGIPDDDAEINVRLRKLLYEVFTGKSQNYNSDYIEKFITFLLNTPSFKTSNLYGSIIAEIHSRDNDRDNGRGGLAKELGIYKGIERTLSDPTIDEIYSLLESYIEDEEHFKLNFPYGRDPKAQLEYMHQKMKSHKYRVTLTTIPFFFVSNYGFLRQPCLLFSNRVTNYNLGSSTLDRVLTGSYQLLGLRHTITANSAESEFILQTLG